MLVANLDRRTPQVGTVKLVSALIDMLMVLALG
jgi:hypothetical protein